jgi:hypothetical protein
MRHTLVLTLALFLIAAAGVFAQETSTEAQNIGSVPTSSTEAASIKTYTVTQAYPIAKTLLNQKIALTGTVGKEIKMPIGIWFYLTEGVNKFSVVKNFSTAVTTALAGKKVKVYGMFTYNAQKQFVFSATGLTVLDNIIQNKL